MDKTSLMLRLKGVAFSVAHYSRTNPTSPIIILFFIFSSFIAIFLGNFTWLIYIWAIVIIIIFTVFLYGLIFNRQILSSEELFLELKKLELLGDKQAGLITEENVQLAQPIFERKKMINKKK